MTLSIGPRRAKYTVIPANEAERLALEKINAMTFEALSITDGKKQIAIIPLDESNESWAHLIVTAVNAVTAVHDMEAERAARSIGFFKRVRIYLMRVFHRMIFS